MAVCKLYAEICSAKLNLEMCILAHNLQGPSGYQPWLNGLPCV